MKTKLVLWGTNAEEKRILIAMELKVDENKVNIYTFPESVATEDFSNQMMREWRLGNEVSFPEGYTVVERELSVTESLLPEDVKVERTDIVNRAQTEWHFIVLSAKMSKMYQSELEDLKSRVDKMERFDLGIWEELKGYWSKVQAQVRDRNLFRDHANSLKESTNELFSKLKVMRATVDEEFKAASKEVHDKFMATIDDIEKKIEGGSHLQNLFNDLKNIQKEFRDSKMTRDHRSRIWEKMDAAFKAVKLKRFGDQGSSGGESSPVERIQRRLKGLLTALDKMDRSIKRDEDDLNFQKKKIDSTDGQLEAQIREAKMLMIEERIKSKKDKLGEMLQTKTELEKRIVVLKAKEEDKAKEAQRKEAQKAAKEKIAQQIKEEKAAIDENVAEKLEKAAEELGGSAPKAKKAAKEANEEEPTAETILDAVSSTLGESMEDIIDTVKAVASVVSEKIEDAVEDIKDSVEEIVEDVKEELSKDEEE